MQNFLGFRLLRAGFLAVACLLAFGTMGIAAEFSAEFTVKAKGEADMVGKVYVKGQKVRQEVAAEGETQIVILRPDKGVTWMITPEEKMYMELPYQSEGISFEEWTADKEKGAKYLGDDKVAGIECKKFEVVEDGDKTLFWISKKHSFPVKIEDSEATIEYKNIKDASVADSLFEIPSGYEKTVIPPMPAEEGAKE
jgi:hypothetical protein